MNEPNTTETAPSRIDEIKRAVRQIAETIPRPINLYDAAREVTRYLDPTDDSIIVLDRLAEWIMSRTEPTQPTENRSTILCGPAPKADDLGAWDE